VASFSSGAMASFSGGADTGQRAGNMDTATRDAAARQLRGVLPGSSAGWLGGCPRGSPVPVLSPALSAVQGPAGHCVLFLSRHARPASHSCRLRPPGIGAPRQLVQAPATRPVCLSH
jgi:hypothetical protein